MRILLAAILGGIAMFAWSSIAHMALPLGETGVRQIPVESEPAVLNAMQTGLSASPGFYIFPGMGHDQKAMQEYDKKLAAAPSGVLIYHPAGASLDMPRHLGVEFFTEFLETFLVIMLLNQTRITSYVARVGFVTLAGILASITANIPYWNWYGFPSQYTAGYMTIQIVGFLVAGLAAAAVMKPAPAQVTA